VDVLFLETSALAAIIWTVEVGVRDKGLSRLGQGLWPLPLATPGALPWQASPHLDSRQWLKLFTVPGLWGQFAGPQQDDDPGHTSPGGDP
jgi:hypothetical protein